MYTTALAAPLLTTNGDVKALVDQLQAMVDTLNQAITQVWFPTVSSQKPAADFVNAWIAWRDGAYAWIRDYRGGLGFFKGNAWSSYDTTNGYLQALLNKWRPDFEKIAHQSVLLPTLPAKPAGREGWEIAKPILAVLGIGTAGFIGYKIYRRNKRA